MLEPSGTTDTATQTLPDTASPGSLREITATLDARNRQIAAVHTISSLLSSSLDLDDRLRDILAVSLQAVDAVAGSILLYRPEDNKLVFRFVVGEKADQLTNLAMNPTEGVSGAVFQSGKPEITNRPRKDPNFHQDMDGKIGFTTESIITVPLKYQAGRPVGVMQILNKQHGDFTMTDLEVLEIVASIAATAIENAQLYRDAKLAAVANAVGDLSHDIKNKVAPIAISAATLELALEDMYDALNTIGQRVSPEVAQEIADALSFPQEFGAETFQMIRDQVQEIQDYTKLIADALKGSISEIQLEPHELTPIIERQVQFLRPVAQKYNVELRTEFGDVPVCRFDRSFVEKAVYNLVNNAIPETENGTVTVRTGAILDGQFPEGKHFWIEVADTGRGMPPSVLERILRGDAKSTKVSGTGLGTRIVYNAVLAHNGRFEGESTPNVGTTFRMKIPILD